MYLIGLLSRGSQVRDLPGAPTFAHASRRTRELRLASQCEGWRQVFVPAVAPPGAKVGRAPTAKFLQENANSRRANSSEHRLAEPRVSDIRSKTSEIPKNLYADSQPRLAWTAHAIAPLTTNHAHRDSVAPIPYSTPGQASGASASIRLMAPAGMSWTATVRALVTGSSFRIRWTWVPPGSTKPIPTVYWRGSHE